jgi:MFS family permease
MDAQPPSSQPEPAPASPPVPLARLPRNVWILGLASLLMDTSSEMIHGLLPLFLVGTLGVSALSLGLIEGVAEAAASISKIFSGALSDRWAKRKPLILFGYGLAALSKPLFPLADSALTVFVARFTDRIGKGIRGAPRDALIADEVPPAQRGRAYGLRQSLDTVGGFGGPLLAIVFVAVLALPLRTVLWIACIPALLTVLVLALGLREPAHVPQAQTRGNPFAGFRFADYPGRFWGLVALVALFTLMRFSEAFLVLRANEAGLSVGFAPMTLVVMSATYMLTAYPVGHLADRMSRPLLLAMGCVVMVVADLLMALGSGLPAIFAGIALWGVHLGMTEGVFSALTADAAPATLRGTAFGVVNLVRGLMLVAASVLAGALWSAHGPSATFLAGAALAGLAALAALSLKK